MGPSSDEDELNVVDEEELVETRKVKSAASSASHADHSNLSTTPQSNDESISDRPKRSAEIAPKRSRTQKRHLSDVGASEKRLIEQLTQENQRLKTELESRAFPGK
jgi:Na+-transporting NADH:ubiquinone oxidoreductase subunit NqrC